MQTTAPTYISAEEVLFLGSRCRTLATSESTGGKYGLVDMIEVAPGDMPPLHVHRTHDERFLLLEGELSLFLPDREIALRPSEFVLAPRGIPTPTRSGELQRAGSFSQHLPASSSSSKTSRRSPS